MPSDAVIFDLGGVVLSWDPRAAYERVLPAEEVATFLERVRLRRLEPAERRRPFVRGGGAGAHRSLSG